MYLQLSLRIPQGSKESVNIDHLVTANCISQLLLHNKQPLNLSVIYSKHLSLTYLRIDLKDTDLG